jgi:hypothetical protein
MSMKHGGTHGEAWQSLVAPVCDTSIPYSRAFLPVFLFVGHRPATVFLGLRAQTGMCV